jgi:hypothetical protein
MTRISIASLVAIAILTGCSKPTPQEANRIVFPRSQGTSYLDASREVIESQGWSLLSESSSGKTSSSTKTGTDAASEEVTITGQTSQGKKVFFMLWASSSAQSAYLEVTTDEGFPLTPKQLVELVKSKRKD